MKARCVLACALVSMSLLAAEPQSEPPPIPRRTLFADFDREQLQLSPDAKWISYRAPKDGTMNVWIATANDPGTAEAVTKQSGAPVIDYRWTYVPGRLLYTTPVDDGSHVFLLDLATRESRDLTPGKGVAASVEKLVPGHPDEALVRMEEPDRSYPVYQRVNLRSGTREIVFKNDRSFERVLFDDDWRARVAMLPRPDLGYDLLKQDRTGAWVPFAGFRLGIEADASQPIAVDGAGKVLYLVDNRDRDTAALKAVDLSSGRETVLVDDPLADVAPALLRHPTTGRLQSAVAGYGRMRRYFLDPSLIPDFEYLRTVQSGDIGILQTGRSLDDRTWLVAFMDGGPTRYYLYDRRARRARRLFSDIEALEAHSLSRRHLEVVTTRDGMQLPADLYLPARADVEGNGRPRQPLPMLVYVHGGSWGTYPWNSWSTNRVLQLLADRGYAVLRVEFRGAGGFGRRIQEAGLHEWGGKMQDDLIDAVDWAIEQGITTRERVGIWGWSYGGYATLEALATSDRFACGLAMYVPTELASFIDEGSPSVQVLFRHHIGDNTTEEGRARLRKQSPLEHVDRFTRPVLVAQGGRDEIVHQGQADRLVAALQEHKKPVTYLLYPDEPHDFRRADSWVSLFAVAERFFHEHLGGRYEPIGNDMQGSLEVRAGAELIPGLPEAVDRKM